MATVLLTMTSFYPETNPFTHPKMCVIFNNVSRNPIKKTKNVQYGGKVKEDELDNAEFENCESRINNYRQTLIEIALQFYSRRFSDQTYVGDCTWEQLKEKAFKNNYQQDEWFLGLSEYEKDLLERLKTA